MNPFECKLSLFIPLHLIKTKECDNVKRKLKLFSVGALFILYVMHKEVQSGLRASYNSWWLGETLLEIDFALFFSSMLSRHSPKSNTCSSTCQHNQSLETEQTSHPSHKLDFKDKEIKTQNTRNVIS